jgi:hypothetical protein
MESSQWADIMNTGTRTMSSDAVGTGGSGGQVGERGAGM